MASNGKDVIIGSSQFLVKPLITEHTVSQEMIIDDKCWRRHVDVDVGKYLFFLMVKDGFVSKKFTAEDDGEVFWTIRVSLEGADNYMISLDMESTKEDMSVLFWARLQTDLTIPFQEKPKYYLYDKIMKPKPRSSWSTKKTTWESSFDFDNKLLEKGFEKFRIDLTYAKMDKDTLMTVQSQSVPTPITANEQRESLASGVAAQFENPIASDVIIRCDDREWKLHKIILAAQSKTFAAMFSVDMKENTEGIVDITDVNSSALDLMFKFLYSVNIDDSLMRSASEDLLILADRYDIPTLKKKSERDLISKLTRDNCLQSFILGHNYNAQQLRASAKQMLSRDLALICNTGAYKAFVRENPELSIEITFLAFQK